MAQAQFSLADIMGAVSASSKAASTPGSEWVKAADLEAKPFAVLGIAKQKSAKYGTEQIVFTLLFEQREVKLGVAPTEQRENMLKVAKQLCEVTAKEPLTLVKRLTARSYVWDFVPHSSLG